MFHVSKICEGGWILELVYEGNFLDGSLGRTDLHTQAQLSACTGLWGASSPQGCTWGPQAASGPRYLLRSLPWVSPFFLWKGRTSPHPHPAPPLLPLFLLQEVFSNQNCRSLNTLGFTLAKDNRNDEADTLLEDEITKIPKAPVFRDHFLPICIDLP